MLKSYSSLFVSPTSQYHIGQSVIGYEPSALLNLSQFFEESIRQPYFLYSHSSSDLDQPIMAGEQRDRFRERPSLNARSSSLNRRASQPILPSSSRHLAGKLSGLVQIEQMFDRFKTELAESNQAISDRLGAARDLPGTSIIIDPGTLDPHRVTKPLPNTTRSSFIQPEKQAAANNQSKRASTSYTNPGKQASKENYTPSSSKPSSNVPFD
jgi:hypothetical protein